MTEKHTMKLTLNEALSNAQTWREKMERLGLVKMPLPPRQEDIAEKVRLYAEREQAKKKRNKEVRLMYQEVSFQENKPKILGVLISDELMQLRDVALATGISCQRILLQARRLESEGVLRVVKNGGNWWIGFKDKPKRKRRMAKPVKSQKDLERESRKRLIAEHLKRIDSSESSSISKCFRNWSMANVDTIGKVQNSITTERSRLSAIADSVGVSTKTVYAALKRVRLIDSDVVVEKDWQGCIVWRKAKEASEAWRTPQ